MLNVQTILRKISTATMGYKMGEVREMAFKAKAEGHETAKLYSIAGKANKIQRGESAMGPWSAARGEFFAVKPDGTMSHSTRFFAPEPLMGMLETKVEYPDEDTGELKNREVEFAFEIRVKYDENSSVGYEYVVSPLQKFKDTGSLDHLLALIPEAQRALPAPEDEAKEEKKAETSATKKKTVTKK